MSVGGLSVASMPEAPAPPLVPLTSSSISAWNFSKEMSTSQLAESMASISFSVISKLSNDAAILVASSLSL